MAYPRPTSWLPQLGLVCLALFAQACTPSSAPTSSANLFLEHPVPRPHNHEAHLPDLDSVVGIHFPGGRGSTISNSPLTASKLTFPMAQLDVSGAQGWKQHSNALSLQLINDLALINDSRIRWYVRNFRPDVPRYPLDPFQSEKRLSLLRRWETRLAEFKTPRELSRLEKLHLEADVRSLRAMIAREILSVENDLQRGDIKDLILNPIWNVHTTQTPEAMSGMLRQMAPAQGPGYFTELRRKIETQLAKNALRVSKEMLNFFILDEQRAAYMKTLSKPFENPSPKDTEALARLELDLAQFGDWMKSHQAELDAQPRTQDKARTEADLLVKYRTAGINATPAEVYAFGERKLREIEAEMKALGPNSGPAPARQAQLLALPTLRSSEDMLDAFHRMADRIDALLRAERIITLPEEPVKIVECNVANYPYKEKMRFCSNLVPSMSAENYLAHSPISNGLSIPRVTFPAFEYLQDKAPKLLKPEVAFPIMAHEARPGHELQFRSFANGQSTLARSFLAEQRLSVEGWALYAEKLVEEAMGEISNDLRAEFLRLRQWRAARVVLESRLYREALPAEEAVQFLIEHVGLDESTAADEVKTRYLDRDFPSDASYLYGYELLLRLREDMRKEFGAKFDLMRFNDAVVKMGFLPPDQIRELVKAEMAGDR
ncbi:MAG: DUF885 family protein [Bdellovibrionaceae bacterium]|nr:DUF885 family protein [Pseudobdellovibrionaceae bacterium]